MFRSIVCHGQIYLIRFDVTWNILPTSRQAAVERLKNKLLSIFSLQLQLGEQLQVPREVPAQTQCLSFHVF